MRRVALGTANESGSQSQWLTPLCKLGLDDMMSGASAVKYIVIHCSATKPSVDYTPERLLADHRARGFRTVGYHFYVRRNGDFTQHRWLLEVGAHCKPYNRCSIGICYEGGLDEDGNPRNTLTAAQESCMRDLIAGLRKLFPQAQVVGHRDLPGTSPKECPCFDARRLFGSKPSFR